MRRTSFVQPHDVVTETGPTSGDHDSDFHVLAQFSASLGGLESKLSCGDNDNGWRNGGRREEGEGREREEGGGRGQGK